jgi:hypothetical protein
MSPGRLDISRRRGDTLRCIFDFVDAAGAPLTLTGRVYAAAVRIRGVAAATSMSASITGAGQVTILLTAAQTALLPLGVHTWDLQETANGDVSTLLAGDLVIVEDVTP